MGTLYQDDNSLNDGGAASLDVTGDNTTGQQGSNRAPETYLSSARYVKNRLLPVLVSVPRLMEYMPNYEERVAVLKTLMEDRATSITGLNSTMTPEFADTVEGNQGEVRQTVVNVKIERSIPAYEWPELKNRVISRFWEQYIRFCMMDPSLGHPGVTYLDSFQDNPIAITEAEQSFVMLFIEPNSEMTDVVNAGLCANMQPQSSGEITGSRVVGEALETPTVTVEFTALTDRSPAVKAMARDYLSNLNKLGLNPHTLATYVSGIQADVAASGNGFASLAETNATNA